MNALPQAMATGHIHSGTIAGKLKGVIPTVTPTLCRMVVTSMSVDAPSVWAPANIDGMPHANSTTSMPRCSSPAAPERTLPCWSLMTIARSSALRFSASRNANSTVLRLDNEVRLQAPCARRADATAVSTSAAEASRTRAATTPRAGSNTSPHRSPVPGHRVSPNQWSITGSATSPVVSPAGWLVSLTILSPIDGSDVSVILPRSSFAAPGPKQFFLRFGELQH